MSFSASAPSTQSSDEPEKFDRLVARIIEVVSEKMGVRPRDLPSLKFHYASRIPVGAGVSSSSAVNIVTLRLLNQAFKLGLSRRELVQLAQEVERRMGAGAGNMDESTIVYLDDTRTLLSLEHPEGAFDVMNIPSSAGILVWASGQVHENDHVTERSHGMRVAESLSIQEQLGFSSYRDLIHESQLFDRGKSRLNDATVFYRGIGYEVKGENLLNRARFHIAGRSRVPRWKDALVRKSLDDLGRILNEVHLSMDQLYDVSTPEINEIVAIARSIPGVKGASITGGGFGGSVVILCVKGRPCIPEFKECMS